MRRPRLGGSRLPSHRLAVGWPPKWCFVSSVVIGVKNLQQLTDNLELGDWDLLREVWQQLEAKTCPPEDYLTWFNRANRERHFDAAEYHDELKELP